MLQSTTDGFSGFIEEISLNFKTNQEIFSYKNDPLLPVILPSYLTLWKDGHSKGPVNFLSNSSGVDLTNKSKL